jgi:hypothetical protein
MHGRSRAAGPSADCRCLRGTAHRRLCRISCSARRCTRAYSLVDARSHERRVRTRTRHQRRTSGVGLDQCEVHVSVDGILQRLSCETSMGLVARRGLHLWDRLHIFYNGIVVDLVIRERAYGLVDEGASARLSRSPPLAAAHPEQRRTDSLNEDRKLARRCMLALQSPQNRVRCPEVVRVCLHDVIRHTAFAPRMSRYRVPC